MVESWLDDQVKDNFLDVRKQEEGVKCGCFRWTGQLYLNVDTGHTY